VKVTAIYWALLCHECVCGQGFVSQPARGALWRSHPLDGKKGRTRCRIPKNPTLQSTLICCPETRVSLSMSAVSKQNFAA